MVGAVGTVVTAVPFVASWSPSARAKTAGAPVEANIGKLQPGQLIIVKWRGKPVWVVRLDNRKFAALAAVCRYQHCVLRWSAEQGVFVCPCHQGTWDREGRNLTGPAAGPMRAFFVNVKADRVRVHLRREAEVEP